MPQVTTATPATDAGDQVRAAIIAMLSKNGGAGLGIRSIASAIGALVSAAYTLVIIIFSAIFSGAATLAALFFDGIEQTRSQNQDKLNSVAAAALTDILAVPISSSDLPSGSFGSNPVQLFRALGGKVLDALTQSLGGSSTSTKGPGETGAQAFLGFGLNHAVMAGLIGLVSEIESLGFIKGFEELGEDIRESLGLGRLMRQALHPLINATITLPYTQETNAKYRPHVLSAAEYVIAVQAGRMQPGDFNTAMARLGFSDTYITELLTQHKRKLQVHQIDSLVRWQRISKDSGIALLVAQGMDSDTANYELDTLDIARADAQENAYASELLSMAKSRELDPATFSQLIQRLHFSPLQQQGWLDRLGVYLDTQTKHITLSQLLYLAEHNLVTTTQIDTWAQQQGYNADETALLELWITQKELDWDAVQAKKKAAAAKAAAKAGGTPAA